MNIYPPPAQDRDLPEYYCGMLIVYEEFAADSCKWVVYDGTNRVRCYTRESAIDYINQRAHLANDRSTELAARARYFILHAASALDKAAAYSRCEDRLTLEKLSVDLRPHVVRIDNYLTYSTKYAKEENEPET